jgi:signal transduction histidine kinase
VRVATKFSVGSFLLLVPLGAVLVHHVNQVEDLAETTQRIAAVQLSAAMSSLALFRQVDLLEEYTQKHFVTGDPDYLDKFNETRESFEIELRSLAALALSEGEHAATARLERRWTQLLRRHPLTNTSSSLPTYHTREKRLQRLRRPFARLRRGAQGVLSASQAAMTAQALSSAKISRDAERVSWMVSALALCLSLLVVYVTVREINRPLRRLIQATRAISKGTFTFQLVSASRGDEFSDLARAFNLMVQRLGELDQMKKDFLSHVSHELKNPLVAMQETNRLLLDGIPGPLTAKQQRLLELNLGSGKRLSAMIADLLDLSRMEAGATFDLEPRDLVELGRSAVDPYEASALDKKLTLTFQADADAIPLRCDGNRIIQVVQNLLDNALKFTPAGGQIDVTIRSVDEEPQSHYPARWRARLQQSAARAAHVLLVVSDSGPGIPDADKEMVFEKFYQTNQDARRAGRGGVGLGLAICREIVEAHHGAIWAADAASGGAAIHLLLPRVLESAHKRVPSDCTDDTPTAPT